MQIDPDLTHDHDDWEILLALHQHPKAWDGMITTDSSMLSLPKELAVLCQTRLTLIVAESSGHDPIRATGLVLAHIEGICKKTRPDVAQYWRLRTSTQNHDAPWDRLSTVARRQGTTAPALYEQFKLSEEELQRPDATT